MQNSEVAFLLHVYVVKTYSVIIKSLNYKQYFGLSLQSMWDFLQLLSISNSSSLIHFRLLNVKFESSGNVPVHLYLQLLVLQNSVQNTFWFCSDWFI